MSRELFNKLSHSIRQLADHIVRRVIAIQNSMNYFLPFSFALIISMILTGFLRNIGLRYGFVSTPRARDIHKNPVPRIGGLAIFLSFLFISLVYFIFRAQSFSFGAGEWLGIDKHLAAILLGGAFIALSMLLDDLKGLKAWQKLFFQVIAVLIIIASGIGIDSLPNPLGGTLNLNSVYIPILSIQGTVYHFSLWSDLLTLIWMVGMMNVINFIDGVDGLAGGVSAIAALTIFLLSISLAVNQPAVALASIILAGSCAGFLVWNFPPAKIFMGDTGSAFLGFMLGVLPLISGGKLATAFLVLGFPIVDGLMVFAGRISRKENPFTTPDKTHLHHRFLKAKFSPRQAILSIYIISAAFGWVALRSTSKDKIIAAIVLVALLVVVTRGLNYVARRANERI
ncbi:MAG: undecaprenyl/decaprenyl-phosphate alpha-N-acetylglucosaminyl 1-phosphate transferase [Patescibacteria group bacterium]|nr:undecaprenyl/decaprenyl-phosphate alpha-N-acetylglucosaminyl 1-phosphate transferase [Patescibacteria group bacterium]